MQGQRGSDKTFADTSGLNQGSNDPNQSINCDNRPYPMEGHNLQSLDGWHIGESSSSTNSNPQSHILGGESNRTPLSFNLNAEHMESGSDNNDAFPYNIDDDGALSFKRKVLEGEAIDSGSNVNTYLPPISQSEEVTLQIGIGHGVAPGVFPPITVTETGESSSRTYNLRANRDNDRINLPSTRNVLNLSDFCARSQMIYTPESIHRPESSRNVPPFSFHGSRHLRGGESLTSAFISAERGVSSREEASSESFTRNSVELSPYAHGRRNSGSHSTSPWATPHRHGSSRNPQRSSQFYPWAPFPSSDSSPSNFPPMRSGQSSEEDIVMLPGSNLGHNRHNMQFPTPSMMTELQGDDISEWHALAADIEGRQRLVSEIRNVLNSMRRGDSLRDEDYMLFDPFINGIAEFHDRHRDMRLDVDNMSYEELLALEERIGDVNTGLSQEAILRSMKQRKHLCLFDRSSSSLEPCSICQEEYVLGDNVGELDCGHDFHTDCVKQWLTQKNLCPICKTTALATLDSKN